ncbi:unannotated protein [freshwater metagenome]|uniref:Unannotated protein n=1 Tax=freshwater metagenome TaxID=449393 RepID=A0A6J6L3W8_9ZZZZ
MGEVGVAHAARHRRGRDDSPVSPIEHVGKDSADRLERSGEIDIDHVVPGVVIEFVKLPVPRHTRIRDTNVDLAEGFDASFHHQTDTGGVTDIGRHRQASLSGGFDQGDGLGQLRSCP